MNWEEQAITSLENDGVILCPTDTVWGLSGNALSPLAAEKIYTLKQRPKKKSFIVLMADHSMLRNFVEQVPQQVTELLNNTTRPTTVIYPNPKQLPDVLLAQDGSIAIRIASQHWLADFINQFGKPIISTSANISGETTPTSFSAISQQIKDNVDFIVPVKQNAKSATSSQILRFNSKNKIEILRR